MSMIVVALKHCMMQYAILIRNSHYKVRRVLHKYQIVGQKRVGKSNKLHVKK